MNQYLLSVYEADGSGPSTAAEIEAFMGRVIALEEEMDRAGVFVFGGALHGPDATTVVRGGAGQDLVTTDGPFVEVKEQIGGFYIIEAEDLDAALSWAAKVVQAIGHDIEVRPFRATGRVQADH
ncbi:YciI family protein [Kribbella sp. NPDC050124]|uniref:YciI family protein n=1 Tax=Kribbella sp. NPDC050124 TaxID=3364114 RepID=UPI0037922E93